MTHRFHPDPARNDPEDAILWDDCEDCARHTVFATTGLDQKNIRRFFRLMMRVETGEGEGRKEYVTRNEAVLGVRMYDAYFLFSRLGIFDLSHVSDLIGEEQELATENSDNERQ